MIGKTFGKFTVLAFVPHAGWRCQCTCGRILIRHIDRVRRNKRGCAKCANNEDGSAPIPSARHCDACGSPTKNPRFCSKSCAAKTTNRENPKRNGRKQRCSSCGMPLSRRKKHQLCGHCAPRIGRWKMTLQQARGRNNRHASVREHAQYVCRNRAKRCAICGYRRMAAVCHVKPIHAFPATSTLGEINRDDNLILMCPTHHWELDHLTPKQRGWSVRAEQPLPQLSLSF